MSNEENHGDIAGIIETNRQIRQGIYEQIGSFLILKNELMEKLQAEQINGNPIIQNNAKFFDTTQIETLHEQIPSSRIQLALVGSNSCGKTSLLHFLLRSGNILPIDIGPVTARIIRLTYADANHAGLYIYPSLNDRTIHQEVPLTTYFTNSSEPNWDGIRTAIEEHVTRPDPKNIPSQSDAFAKWAKYFVEIRIPSSFLKLGIDLYDTPGLLFSDAPILKINLCQLVKSIKPTLVFMYENASITSDTRDCFLAIKQAIGPVSNLNIFFLNTKADIESIIADVDPDNLGIDDERLSQLIFEERQRRYELLLNISSIINEFPQELPSSIRQCPCFDLISVHSDLDSLGAELNTRTLHRLIQFTAHADLRIARQVSSLVMPMIDAFFDLLFTSHHRTLAQFQNLRIEALRWTDYFYTEYEKLMENFLDEFYENILRQIEENLLQLAQRASVYQSRVHIDEYIKSVFQQEIIKYQIRQMRRKYTDRKFLDQLTDVNLVKIAQRNEFLIAAQRHSNWLCQLEIHSLDKRSTRQIFAEQTILAQILLISDVFLESTDLDQSKRSSLADYRQLFKRKSSLGKESPVIELAKERLNDLCLWLIEQRSYINRIIKAGYEVEKRAFIEKIYQFSQLAERSIGQREKLYRLIEKYSEKFATIECRILGTLNSEKKSLPIDSFRPLGNDLYIDPHGYLIKKTSNYLEGHHHLRMIQLNIPNIYQLSDLYENHSIYLIFPKNYRRLREIDLTINNIFEICSDLANTLSHLHSYAIIHGDTRVDSLFFDQNNQCYLSNFHFDRKDHLTIDDDILSLANLGKYLAQRIANNGKTMTDDDHRDLRQLDQLFSECLLSDRKQRLTAAEIRQRIKEIRKNL